MPNLVAIDLPGGPSFVDSLKRAWDRGDAVLPFDQRLSAPAKAKLLDALKPAVIVSADGRHKVAAARPTETGDALVVATSVTTGEPKGVVLTHAAVEASALATTERLQVDHSRHRWLACLPLSHVGGLSVITRALITGTPLTVIPDSHGIEERAGTDVFVSLVPTLLRRIDPAAFHTIVLGGSAPPATTPPNVVTTYGLTETGSGVVYDGVPLEGVEVAIDPTTAEIRIRCPMLLRSYRDGKDPRDEEGWFATGDAGHFDADQLLHVDGRLTEMIITGGDNVWPATVEAALRSHPQVADVAVTGRSDEEWGQRVVAWVVPTDPLNPPTLDELRAAVRMQLAPYAAPRQLILVEELPTTAIGKLQRDLLPPG